MGVAAVVGRLILDVPMPGALGGCSVGTMAAIFVLGADEFAGGQFIAGDVQLGAPDGLVFVEVLFAIDELRGDLHGVKKGCRLLERDAVVDDGVADARERELDGSNVLGRGELQGPILEVRLGAYGVDLGVVVAKLVAGEGRGRAAEAVGFDVATDFDHDGCPLLPLPFFR